MRQHRGRLLAKDIQAATHGFLAIVVPLVERTPTSVAAALRRLEGGVKHRAARTADAAAREPAHHLVPRHGDLDHRAERLAAPREELLQRLRLGYRTGESVEDEAPGAVGHLQALVDQADHEVIRHQEPLLDDALGFAAERGPRLDGFTQHVTRRDVRYLEPLFQQLRLGSLTRTRRPHHDHPHPRPHTTAARGSDHAS